MEIENSNTKLSLEKANCRYCGSDLNSAASLCHACGYYQDRWKNTIPHIGTALAVITVIISGFTFVLSSASDWLSNNFGQPRLEVLALNSDGATTFRNIGPHDVLVRFQKMELTDGSTNRFINVDRIVESGKSLVFSVLEANHVYVEDYQAIEVKNKSDREKILKEFKLGSHPRWNLLYFDNSHPQLATYRDFTKGRIITLPARSTITYSSWEKGAEYTTTVDCTAVLVDVFKWNFDQTFRAENSETESPDEFPRGSVPAPMQLDQLEKYH